MNNNRGNNRRRGRGNNRQQGGQQTNRIDSRARGNAPQLLEKYRKLAHDAHLNGDRVTEEYYLQFADHYFRVIADQKQRQEESRQPRRDDRPNDYGDDYGTEDDSYEYGQLPSQPSFQAERAERAPRQEREPRGEREGRQDREQRPRRQDEVEAADPVETAVAPESEGGADRPVYEPAENPFVRDSRASRGLKQRKPRRPREDDGAEEPNGNVDPSVLPPSITARAPEAQAADVAAGAADAATEEAPAEKPRRRRTRKAAGSGDETGGTLEAVES